MTYIVEPLKNIRNLKMLNCNTLFPVFVRLISRSHILEKMPGSVIGADKKKLKIEETQKVPVETDTEKLAKYVCGSNLFIEGGEDIKLKDDSEYPDWLWEIRSPLPLNELSPKTKTYWNRIRKMRERENKYLLTLQKHKTVHK